MMEKENCVKFIHDKIMLAEQNSELIRNGRRSRGPSPNDHCSAVGIPSLGNVAGNSDDETATPDSFGDENSVKRNGKSKTTKQSEYEEKIRIGCDYQAVCPPLIPESERKPELLNDRALLVWSPTNDIPETKLEEYISVAKEKYGYNGEQSLGMLFWHNYDLKRAVMDLANFTQFPDEWTAEDKVIFALAFQFHGKSFQRIRQMLPDKSTDSLVKYYYTWKKTRYRQSAMDRQDKVKANSGGYENDSDNESNGELDNDDKDQLMPSTSYAGSHGQVTAIASGNVGVGGVSGVLGGNAGCNDAGIGRTMSAAPIATTNSSVTINIIKRPQKTNLYGGRSLPINAAVGGVGGTGGSCTNCGVACNLLNSLLHGKLCFNCHNHWRRTGNKRPTSDSCLNKRYKRKPPRGMYINHGDIVTLANAPGNGNKLIPIIDREIVTLLTQVQFNKKRISALKKKNSESKENLRTPKKTNRINARWTNNEVLMGVECVRKLGMDFQAIAEILGTKNETHVRTFYATYRHRYNLDQLAKQHEDEKEEAIAAAAASAATSSSSNEATALFSIK